MVSACNCKNQNPQNQMVNRQARRLKGHQAGFKNAILPGTLAEPETLHSS